MDDQTVVTRAVGNGWDFNPMRNIMEYSKEREERDTMLSDVERTSGIIARIANSIEPSIQVTTNWPERNGDGRMPILDLKVWVKRLNGIFRISLTFF